MLLPILVPHNPQKSSILGHITAEKYDTFYILLTNCETTVGVWHEAGQGPPGDLSPRKLTSGTDQAEPVLKSSLTRGHITGQGTWVRNGSHRYKVVKSYLDRETENFSVRPGWPLLEPEEALVGSALVELHEVSEGPSSPSYVTVSTTTEVGGVSSLIQEAKEPF